MRSILLTTALLLSAAFATAQSSPVKNTGCPDATYPTITTAKVNQPVTITFPTMDILDVPVLVLGYQSGNTVTFNAPFTCVNGCGYYPAALITLGFARNTTKLTFNVPNDPTLFQTCWAMQTAAVKIHGCVDLHGAVSFCIGR